MRLARSKYYTQNRATLLNSGAAFFETMKQLLDGAEKEIYLQTYILEEDETGHYIMDALMGAAGRGVRVMVLPDAYGSGKLKQESIRRLKSAGVQIRLFGPLFSKGRLHFGRRLHHKICVVDRKLALVTGINLSNNYSGFTGKAPWLDFGVLVEGEIVPSLVRICERMWYGFRLKSRWTRHEKQEFILPTGYTDQVLMRSLENDALRGKYQCAFSYHRAISLANDSITIIGGYFLPGGRARRALRKAITRGVRIRVILPSKSDVGMMHRGMQYLYAWLLRQRIELYEYLPSNVHGKVIIADNQLVSIGSYDLNNLSTFSNIELNLEILNGSFAAGLTKQLDYVVNSQCHKVTITELHQRYSLFSQFKLWLSYRVVKLMFVLAMWLSKEEEV
jgi:cardiolipin synthase